MFVFDIVRWMDERIASAKEREELRCLAASIDWSADVLAY